MYGLPGTAYRVRQVVLGPAVGGEALAAAAGRGGEVGVEALEERRAAPDPPAVGVEGEDRLAVEQVFVDRPVAVPSEREFLEGKIPAERAV